MPEATETAVDDSFIAIGAGAYARRVDGGVEVAKMHEADVDDPHRDTLVLTDDEIDALVEGRDTVVEDGHRAQIRSGSVLNNGNDHVVSILADLSKEQLQAVRDGDHPEQPDDADEPVDFVEDEVERRLNDDGIIDGHYDYTIARMDHGDYDAAVRVSTPKKIGGSLDDYIGDGLSVEYVRAYPIGEDYNPIQGFIEAPDNGGDHHVDGSKRADLILFVSLD